MSTDTDYVITIKGKHEPEDSLGHGILKRFWLCENEIIGSLLYELGCDARKDYINVITIAEGILKDIRRLDSTR